MKLKLDANGNVVTQDVNGVKCPVYTHDDGKDYPHDAPSTVAKIGQLNGEARSHRERAEAAETKLNGYKDIADPAAALKALATVKNLDDKKLVDAGEVERVKSEAIASVEAKYKPFVEENERLKAERFNDKLSAAFSGSAWIKKHVAEGIGADLLQARFGAAFKMGETGLYAVNEKGDKLYSKSRHGEVANFDEAVEILIDGYSGKAGILKGHGGSGSGTNPAGGGSGAGGKVQMTRSAFEALDPAARHAAMSGGKTELVDG